MLLLAVYISGLRSSVGSPFWNLQLSHYTGDVNAAKIIKVASISMMTKDSLTTTIQSFPAPVQAKLHQILWDEAFDGVIAAADWLHLANLWGCSLEQLMRGLVVVARLYARPIISNYHVGIVAQGLSGNLYFGANMEFAGQPLNMTVHGEQAAVLNAWIHGEQGLAAIALRGAPCGHCRQFLNELSTAAELRIILAEGEPVSLPTLLPGAFGPHKLGQAAGLMQSADHRLKLRQPSGDPTTLAALKMANRSYAPYSQSYSGAALLTSNGQIYAAPYAENVAFNPSLSPLLGALTHLNQHGQAFETIQKAVLVEMDGALSSQVDTARAVLRSVSKAELTVEYAFPT
jgi:cytidine deaminase